jgi:hypothetical protein
MEPRLRAGVPVTCECLLLMRYGRGECAANKSTILPPLPLSRTPAQHRGFCFCIHVAPSNFGTGGCTVHVPRDPQTRHLERLIEICTPPMPAGAPPGTAWRYTRLQQEGLLCVLSANKFCEHAYTQGAGTDFPRHYAFGLFKRSGPATAGELADANLLGTQIVGRDQARIEDVIAWRKNCSDATERC